MAILRERAVWKAPRPAHETRRATDLTPEETEHARLALRFMRTRIGAVKLAEALRVQRRLIGKACVRGGKPSAVIAIRLARVAGTTVEDVLAGRWPPDGACPYCGRTE